MLDDPVSAVLEGTGMVVRCAPAPLRSHLGCFWALPDDCAATIETIPDGGGQLVVGCAAVLISGPRNRPGSYHKPAGTRGGRLRRGRSPMCGLVDRRVRMRAPELERDMAAARSIAACFDALESYLTKHLSGAAMDARVAAAIGRIGQSGRGVPIDDVARECGVSRRHLERLMRLWVGLSPKRLDGSRGFRPCLAMQTS